MKNTSYDWSAFTKRIAISDDLSVIFNSWTTRAGLESWFLSKAKYKDTSGKIRSDIETIGAGDTYTWEWVAANDVVEGEVLAIEDQKSISFTFLGCKVDVSFYMEMGESVVEVVQYNIPTDEASKIGLHLECTEGWTFYLTNLKSVLEGGKDLRNRNEGINNIVNS